MSIRLRDVRSAKYREGWKGRSVIAELTQMLGKGTTEQRTTGLHSVLWGCDVTERDGEIEISIPTNTRHDFIIIALPTIELTGYGDGSDLPTASDVLEAARSSSLGMIKRITSSPHRDNTITVFQIPKPAAGNVSAIQSICIVLARADGELHREINICNVKKINPAGIHINYSCDDNVNSGSCDLTLIVEREPTSTNDKELVLSLFLFPEATSSVCDDIIYTRDVSAARSHCSSSIQLFLSQSATSADGLFPNLPKYRVFQIISFIYNDHGLIINKPTRTTVRTSSTRVNPLKSQVKSVGHNMLMVPSRIHKSSVDMLYGASKEMNKLKTSPIVENSLPSPQHSSNPSDVNTDEMLSEDFNSVCAREGSVATSLLDKTGFLKVSVILTKRPLTQELVRALRRIFHSELTSTWVGTEKLRPCDIRPRQKVSVASYGSSAFIKFMSSYTEAVTLVNHHTSCSEERNAKTRFVSSDPSNKLSSRRGKKRTNISNGKLLPIRATEMVLVLTLITGMNAPWEVEWFTFLLLSTIGEDLVQRFLVPFRSVFDKFCKPNPPSDEVEFYRLIRNLNGGDHLPLDSLWKVFFAEKPTFSEALLALFPRVQQIAIIGRCTEVHPNVHLQAYERAIKKKIRIGLQLLVRIDISVLRRYFTLILSSALQAKSRRLTQYRDSLEMTRHNQSLMYRRYFNTLLAHHKWCHEYHDRVQKSKALMWRTNAGLATTYWVKLRTSVTMNRRKKIFSYKLEKIRITHDRQIIKSKVLHKKYFHKWIKWFLSQQHILLLKYLLRDIRIGVAKVYFLKLISWIKRFCKSRLMERLTTLMANTKQHTLSYIYKKLRGYPNTKAAAAMQLQTRAYLLKNSAAYAREGSRELETQQAILQERKYAVFLVENWWKYLKYKKTGERYERMKFVHSDICPDKLEMQPWREIWKQNIPNEQHGGKYIVVSAAGKIARWWGRVGFKSHIQSTEANISQLHLFSDAIKTVGRPVAEASLCRLQRWWKSAAQKSSERRTERNLRKQECEAAIYMVQGVGLTYTELNKNEKHKLAAAFRGETPSADEDEP